MIMLLFIMCCRSCNYFLSLSIPASAWLLKALDAIMLIRKWQCNCILSFMEKCQFSEKEIIKGQYMPSASFWRWLILWNVFSECEELEPYNWDNFKNIIGNELSLGSLNLREEKYASPNYHFILVMQVTKMFLT